MLTLNRFDFRKCSAQLFTHHVYRAYRVVSTPVRQLSSDNKRNPPAKNFIQIASSNNDNTFEIYDTPYDKSWEEDPEFDYAEITPVRPFYPFITDQVNFELEELVMLLRSEGIKDIACINLPKNPLATYMIIGSGNTNRHVRSTATLIHKILKHKYKLNGLRVPRFDGLDGSCEWIAINLGEILLHLFISSTRNYYDLESLWSAGSQFDEKVQLPRLVKHDRNYNVSWNQLIAEIEAEKKMVANGTSHRPKTNQD